MEIKIKRNSDEDSTLSQPAAPQPGTPPVSAPQPGRMKIGLKKTEPPPVSASAPAPEAAPAAAPVPTPVPAPAAKPGMARINLKPKKETPAPAPVAPVAPAAPAAAAKTPEPSIPPKTPAAPDRPPKKEKPEKAEANQATPKDRKSIGGLALKIAVGLVILGAAGVDGLEILSGDSGEMQDDDQGPDRRIERNSGGGTLRRSGNPENAAAAAIGCVSGLLQAVPVSSERRNPYADFGDFC